MGCHRPRAREYDGTRHEAAATLPAVATTQQLQHCTVRHVRGHERARVHTLLVLLDCSLWRIQWRVDGCRGILCTARRRVVGRGRHGWRSFHRGLALATHCPAPRGCRCCDACWLEACNHFLRRRNLASLQLGEQLGVCGAQNVRRTRRSSALVVYHVATTTSTSTAHMALRRASCPELQAPRVEVGPVRVLTGRLCALWTRPSHCTKAQRTRVSVDDFEGAGLVHVADQRLCHVEKDGR